MDNQEETIDFRSRVEKAEAYNIPVSEPDRFIVRTNKGAYGFTLKNLDFDVQNGRVSKDMILPTIQQANKICEITYAQLKRSEFSWAMNQAKSYKNIRIFKIPFFNDISFKKIP